MLYRIEILKGHVRQIVCTHYRSGAGVAEVEAFAEGQRKLQDGDGFRLCDLHNDEVIEIGALEVRNLERESLDHAALIAQLKASSAVILPNVSD